MSTAELIIAIFIISSIAFLITYVTNFIFLGLPSIFVIFITCAIALKVILFAIGRRD